MARLGLPRAISGAVGESDSATVARRFISFFFSSPVLFLFALGHGGQSGTTGRFELKKKTD